MFSDWVNIFSCDITRFYIYIYIFYMVVTESSMLTYNNKILHNLWLWHIREITCRWIFWYLYTHPEDMPTSCCFFTWRDKTEMKKINTIFKYQLLRSTVNIYYWKYIYFSTSTFPLAQIDIYTYIGWYVWIVAVITFHGIRNICYFSFL